MICRERKFTAPDEEMVEGWGRVLSPATARIRPEFRFLRNQTKRTQKCDKIKAKATLRCNLKIVCSNFCSIARDTSVPPKLLRIAAGGEARCPTSFVNDLVLPVVVVPCNRMEK